MSAMSFAIANSVRFSRETEYIYYLNKLKNKEEENKKKNRKGIFIWRKNVTKDMIDIFEPRDKKIDSVEEKESQKQSQEKIRCCI